MNDSEQFDPNDTPANKPENLDAQIEGLRKLFFVALVALLVLSVSWNIFLIRQTNFVRKDLKNVRPQVNQMVSNYQKAEDPEIKRFLNSLVAFGQKYPDFNPILTKYNIPLTGVPIGTNPAPANAPAAPSK